MKDKTVGEIVSDDIRTANVFKKYGLDFCCGGGEKLKIACSDKNINIDDLMADLKVAIKDEKLLMDFQKMPLDKLVDYIFQKHHTFIYENARPTAEFIQKVASVHGANYPETIEISTLYMSLMDELHSHMMKEERILFPYIKQLVQQPVNNGAFINGPISVMMTEHDQAGTILKKMNSLSNNYQAPSDGCNTFKAAYASIKSMEEDIYLHIHLENNILFPKALELEEKLTR